MKDSYDLTSLYVKYLKYYIFKSYMGENTLHMDLQYLR